MLHSSDKLHLVMFNDLLIYCWSLFAKLFQNAFMFTSIICSFLVMPFSGFDIRVILALQNELRSITSTSMSWKICVESILFSPQIFGRVPLLVKPCIPGDYLCMKVFTVYFLFFFRRYKVIQVIYFFLCELWYLFQGICPLHLINKFIGMKVFIIFSRVISPFLFLTLVICVLQLFFSLICLEVYQYY